MKQKYTLLSILFLLILNSPVALATTIAQLKGTYAFQMSGVKNPYGYYSGGTFIAVSGNCPINQHCGNVAMVKAVYGTISFDGRGHATFQSITNINDGGGGPIVGTVWAYSVVAAKPNTVLLGTLSNGAYLTLGNFNAGNVAQTALMRTIDDSAEYDSVILQR